MNDKIFAKSPVLGLKRLNRRHLDEQSKMAGTATELCLKRLNRRHLDELYLGTTGAYTSLKRLNRRHLDEQRSYLGTKTASGLKRLNRRHLDEHQRNRQKRGAKVLSA